MKFDQDLQDVVYYRLERVMRAAKAHTRKIFKEQGFGVTLDQWLVLKRVSEEPAGLTQMELSNTIFKDPAAITRIVDLLEKRGLIKRETIENDRRAYLLLLTQKGLELVKKMTPYVQALRAQGLKELEKDEIENLKIFLDKMYQGLEL